MTSSSIIIPADVPSSHHGTFVRNYNMMTHHTGRLFLFTADHKIEHLNDDFASPFVPAEARDPEHLFRIAAHGSIGAFATQLGLIARYGRSYPSIPYVVKLNSKSNLVPLSARDPLSASLASVEDALNLAKNGNLDICGIGYTVYLGSIYEPQMLHEASQAVISAHTNGLVALIWMYPRGHNISNQYDPRLLAGAAGVASCLGADFVKLALPSTHEITPHQFNEIVIASGRTRVICAGGAKTDPLNLLAQVALQLEQGSSGVAMGRNIYQQSLSAACAVTDALSALIYQQADLATAQSYLRKRT